MKTLRPWWQAGLCGIALLSIGFAGQVLAQAEPGPSLRGPYRSLVIEEDRAILGGETGTVEIPFDSDAELRRWGHNDPLPEDLPPAADSIVDRYHERWWLAECVDSAEARALSGADCTLYRSGIGEEAIAVLDSAGAITLGSSGLVAVVMVGGEVVFPGQEIPAIPSPSAGSRESFLVAYDGQNTLWLANVDTGVLWESSFGTWIRRDAAPPDIGKPRALTGDPNRPGVYLLGEAGLAHWPEDRPAEILHLAPLEQRLPRSLLAGIAVALVLLALIISMAAFIYRKYRRGPPRRWSITDAAVGVTTFLIIQAGCHMILIAIWGLSVTDPLAMSVAFCAGSATALCWVGLRMYQSGISARDIGLPAAPRNAESGFKMVGEILWGVLAVPVAWALVLLTAIGSEALGLPGFLYRQESITGALASDGLVDLIALAVMSVVLAPLVEEILFRGFLLSAIRSRWGVIPAVVITTSVFGLMHVEGILTVGMLGLVFALLTLYRRSLVPAIVAHAVINGVSFALVASS